VLKTACHEWHVAHGGRMVDFAGWEMPVQYATIIQEHHAVRRAAGLFDIAHMGRLRFTGPDREAFLDRLVTNDLTRLAPGQICYALVTNEQGGILDDVLVYRFDEFWLLVVNASGGWVWRDMKAARLRSLRELAAISRVKSVMYDVTTAHRRQGLIGRFQAAEARGWGMRGGLVHIPQSPFRVARGFEASRDTQRRTRAEQVIAHLDPQTEQDWEQVARANTDVETVLRALGRPTTARLLRHAYTLAMCNTHVLFGWGLLPVPDQSEFEALLDTAAD
jgi:folate-binding Fe-S cluster repair protein YgfZ